MDTQINFHIHENVSFYCMEIKTRSIAKDNELFWGKQTIFLSFEIEIG